MGGLPWGWPFPGSYQVPSIHGSTRLQQLVHKLTVTLQTGPVQGRAVQLGREREVGCRKLGHPWSHPMTLLPVPLPPHSGGTTGLVPHETKALWLPRHAPCLRHPHYLVMGIGVPSVRQVLVNQGLLVLGSCLQEHLQVHGFQLGLWLRLSKFKVLVTQSCLTSWTTAARLLCPWDFSRQEDWSGLSFPTPGDLPDPGIEPWSPALQADSLPSEAPGKPGEFKDKAHSLERLHWDAWPHQSNQRPG